MEKEETEKSTEVVSKEMEQMVAYIENLSVLDLSKLIKVLEDRLGVSAAAPVAVAAAAGAVGGAEEAKEEKTEFDVVLKEVGSNKIAVIKVVRAVTGLGLKEAKDLVEGAPNTIKEAVKKEDAEKMQEDLKGAGATVELK